MILPWLESHFMHELAPGIVDCGLGVFSGGFNGRVCTQFLTTDEAAFACVTSIRLAVIDWPVCWLFVVAHLVVGCWFWPGLGDGGRRQQQVCEHH